eukprot:1140280-Pelagomonas_calceolata.AAC.3
MHARTHTPSTRCLHASYQVALARAVETGEVVALKRIFIRDASGGGLPDNVIREIKCMQSLEHPNVVQLKHVFAKVCAEGQASGITHSASTKSAELDMRSERQ